MYFMEKWIFVSLLLISAWIFDFVLKRKRKAKEKATQIKLQERAHQYFVTICYKTLTSFGDEDNSRTYKTFYIADNYLYVFQKRLRYKSEPDSWVAMQVKFEGNVIIDHKSGRVFSCGEFERYLRNFLKNSLVYDSRIRNQWSELQKQGKIK